MSGHKVRRKLRRKQSGFILFFVLISPDYSNLTLFDLIDYYRHLFLFYDCHMSLIALICPYQAPSAFRHL
jgi:hypothetical protein